MKFVKSYATVLATALFLFGGSAAPALAVTNSAGELPTSYVAAFAPIFGASGVPHSGTMRLVVRDGTIYGTYTGTSVAPDFSMTASSRSAEPSTKTTVTLHLFIGGVLSLQGTMANDGRISGTATISGRLYEFESPAPGRGIVAAPRA